jgi:hypothetical protein
MADLDRPLSARAAKLQLHHAINAASHPAARHSPGDLVWIQETI